MTEKEKMLIDEILRSIGLEPLNLNEPRKNVVHPVRKSLEKLIVKQEHDEGELAQ